MLESSARQDWCNDELGARWAGEGGEGCKVLCGTDLVASQVPPACQVHQPAGVSVANLCVKAMASKAGPTMNTSQDIFNTNFDAEQAVNLAQQVQKRRLCQKEPSWD